MNSRERVLAALNFETTDRVPMDLGAMGSTGISAFAYPRLVEALGLEPRLPRVHDSFQMLALPDLDVLDAMDCDVVTVYGGTTNAFDQPEQWFPYDYNGRLPALVQYPDAYEELDDGSVRMGGSLMVPDSYVFDAEHGGQPVNWDQPIPREDLDEVRSRLETQRLNAEQIASCADHCRKVREASDRCVFFNGQIGTGMGIAAQGGIGVFPLLCVTEPDYVHAYHRIVTDFSIAQARAVMPMIRDHVDVVMMAADDWGTQKSCIASPEVFRTLFKPYIQEITAACHEIAPDVKLFLHSCGAIYDIIDDIIECGFDVLNPVQWSAGERSFGEWKEKCHQRIALWGGGCNAQVTLATGTLEELEAEVREVVPCLARGGGYVFNSIHNILAEIPPEKVAAMYAAARTAV